MNTQTNKNIMKELAKTFTVSPEVKTYYEDVRQSDETQDLISSLNHNLQMLTQSEKRLSFMIGEVRATIKKRI